MTKLPGKLAELSCSTEMLENSTMPVMTLETLSIHCSDHQRPIDFALILRHKMKKLDLSELDFQTLQRNQINAKKASECSVEHLVLNVKDSDLEKDINPMINKFCKCMPKLRRLDLFIEKTLYYEDLATQLIDIYEEIVAFEARLGKEIQKLQLCFFGDTFVRDDEEEVDDAFWMHRLKKHYAFKDAKFESDYDSSTQVVELKKTINKMSLEFKASVAVLNEVEYKNNFEDNMGSDYDENRLYGDGADEEENFDYPDEEADY